jgi:excisionase family DNA binding protein
VNQTKLLSRKKMQRESEESRTSHYGAKRTKKVRRLEQPSCQLTTQQAADFLNVSRPHLVSLLEKGEISFHKVGTHRRIYFSELTRYKAQRDAASREAARELTRMAQEDELGSE